MRFRKAMTALLAAAVFASGCSGETPPESGTDSGESTVSAISENVSEAAGEPQLPAEPDPTDDNYRVFYEIFVGSFSDSDGDGTGDLRGIINRLDYLNDGNINSGKSLGVQGLWLSPIFSSASYHKYDVIDYYSISRQFGTEDDLKELIEQCHSRNMKIFLDLPINHTSSSNRWFQSFVKARQDGDTENEYYDFYTCCTKEEQLPGHAYTSIKGTDLFYESNFSDSMPELDFDSEKVRLETLKIAEYYLDLGVDGFRFDAIKYIYYQDHGSSVDFWKWYMDSLRAIKPDIYCVGECWASDADTLKYYPAMNCFDFQTAGAEGVVSLAAKGGNIGSYTGYIEKYLTQIDGTNENAMLVPFLSNHDTDRAAGFLSVDFGQMKMGANLYMLCSGSPFMYYGEEIGMKGTRGTSDTDANRRLAMLWGDGDTVRDPVGADYSASKQKNGTVSQQLEDENSLYNHYRRLISIRVKYPAIARGSYKAISFGENKCGGFLVTYGDQALAIIHNTSAEDSVTVDLSVTGYEFSGIAECLCTSEAELDGSRLTLPPQCTTLLTDHR